MKKKSIVLLVLSLSLLFAGTGNADVADSGPVVTILYNRGDDGDLTQTVFFDKVKSIVEEQNRKFGVPAKSGRTPKKNTVNDEEFWQWQKEGVAARLLAGYTKSGREFRAEYIRLLEGKNLEDLSLGGANDTIKRRDIKESHLVVNTKAKTAYIKDIPMVDQGEKGYCLPATLSRVFALYGMESIDQHSLAALCDSSGDGGTSTLAMEQALGEIARKFHLKFQILDGPTYNWLETYNKIARKKRAQLLLAPDYLKADPAILREARTQKQQLKRWMNEIRKTINSGVPVLWSVQLGLYPESVPIPQARGGHMRLIIGYDDSAGTIIFSDSWGKGHEMKTIKQADACAMTFRCYTLRSTK
ncbi:MAG: C39 family peptidase [Opitutales bacterium]|nr:C39 family peptidase [Opitutales bacterium]